MEEEFPKIDIYLPQCNAQSVVGWNVGLRPYRTGGIRLELEKTNDDQSVYHNYGHGGAGASLAPGCAKYIVELFSKTEEIGKEIAVVGAGYAGLFTAKFLNEKGYKVTVYAAQMPEKDCVFKENHPCITSLVAGGYWMPFGADVGDVELFEQLQKDSWNYYHRKIIDQSLPGLKIRNAYSLFPDDPLAKHPLVTGLIKSKKIKLSADGKNYIPAWSFETIHMDGNLLIPYLYENLSKKGIKFINKKFSSSSDLKTLNEKIIFNCTGGGNLFNDPNLINIRGQTLYLIPQPEVDYFLFGPAINTDDGRCPKCSIYPGSRHISVGLTYEKSGNKELRVDQQTLERLRLNVEHLVNLLTGKKAVPNTY